MKRYHMVLRPIMFICLATALTVAARAQSDLTLIVADRYDNRDTLHWGLIPTATSGIDRAFGEEEIPPPPPSFIFDARWGSIGPMMELGQGMLRNYRGYSMPEQRDTFNLRVQTGADNFPVVITWPSLAPHFRTATLRYISGDGRTRTIDMRKKTSVSLDHGAAASLITIVTSGPKMESSMSRR